MGLDLRRFDHRHGYPRPAAPPLDNHQHPRGELQARLLLFPIENQLLTLQLLEKFLGDLL